MRLEAAHVSFRYGRKGPWILEDLSLAVESGQHLGLFAPSGYGKSTLARLLAGYLAPQKGKILLDGAALPKKGVCPVQLICQHPEKASRSWRRAESFARTSWPPLALKLPGWTGSPGSCPAGSSSAFAWQGP